LGKEFIRQAEVGFMDVDKKSPSTLVETVNK